MRKEKELGRLMNPGCDGGTLTNAYRLLAEVYQLLNEYAPVWYSADLRDQLQDALRRRSKTRRRHAMAKVSVPKFRVRRGAGDPVT